MKNIKFTKTKIIILSALGILILIISIILGYVLPTLLNKIKPNYTEICTLKGAYLDSDDSNEIIVNKKTNKKTQQWMFLKNGLIKNIGTNTYLYYSNKDGIYPTLKLLDKNSDKNSVLNYKWIWNRGNRIQHIETKKFITHGTPSTLKSTPSSTPSNKVYLYNNILNNGQQWHKGFSIKKSHGPFVKLKNIVSCSTDNTDSIDNHPDFYKYMLKSECKSHCLYPIH